MVKKLIKLTGFKEYKYNTKTLMICISRLSTLARRIYQSYNGKQTNFEHSESDNEFYIYDVF